MWETPSPKLGRCMHKILVRHITFMRKRADSVEHVKVNQNLDLLFLKKLKILKNVLQKRQNEHYSANE